MKICDEYVTFRCGHQVRRGNIAPNIASLLMSNDEMVRLHGAFVTNVGIPRATKRGVMDTAFRLLPEGMRIDTKRYAPLAFALWLMAVWEKYPCSLTPQDIGARIVSRDISAADFVEDTAMTA